MNYVKFRVDFLLCDIEACSQNISVILIVSSRVIVLDFTFGACSFKTILKEHICETRFILFITTYTSRRNKRIILVQ
jgi:hypothetical protein